MRSGERWSGVYVHDPFGVALFAIGMGAYLGVLTTAIGDCTLAVASPNDAEAVLGLRDRLAQHLLDQGVRQWTPGELPGRWIEDRIAARSVYLLHCQNQLVGSVTITSEDPSIWGDPDDRAGYIHMLMVDRRFGGHGIGRSLLGWCEQRIETGGRAFARLDCVRSNERLRRYYEDVGYRIVGYRDFPEIPWAFETALYEKPLGPS